MAIVAKETGTDFVPAPAGVHSSVCCDVVDLGTLEVTYAGQTKKQHKIRIVWQIEEVMSDDKPYIVSKRYTLSLHEKASLRRDLESWRGRAFTALELEGFDVEVLLNVGCLLNVVHNPGSKGGMFANVAAIMRLPKGTPVIAVRDYIRVCDREPKPQQQQAPESESWGITYEDVPF